MIPIITPVRIKGKIFVKMLLKMGEPAALLSSEFRSVASVKRVTRDCGYQYCTPTAFRLMFGGY